jgi:hypothetical protein
VEGLEGEHADTDAVDEAGERGKGEALFASNIAVTGLDAKGSTLVWSFSGSGPSQSKAHQEAALAANRAVEELILALLAVRREAIQNRVSRDGSPPGAASAAESPRRQ